MYDNVSKSDCISVGVSSCTLDCIQKPVYYSKNCFLVTRLAVLKCITGQSILTHFQIGGCIGLFMLHSPCIGLVANHYCLVWV